jgi:hypothetical protein
MFSNFPSQKQFPREPCGVGGANRAKIGTRSVSQETAILFHTLFTYHFHRKRTLSGMVTAQVD